MPSDLKIYALGEVGLQNIAASMSQPPGGGSDIGGLEARVAKIEASVEHIRGDISDIKVDIRELRTCASRDLRTLFGAIIAVALGLAGLLARGFGWL